jgi:hypothetical protein
LTIQYGLAAAAAALRDSGLDVTAKRILIASASWKGPRHSGAANVIKVYESMRTRQKIHPYNAIGGYCGEGSSTIGIISVSKGMP